MGKSRGGRTTKIHALVDAEGLPIMLKLTEGQAHDGKRAEDMLTDLSDGQILLADRTYDSDTARQKLAARRLGQHQTHAEPEEHSSLQSVSLPISQSG